MWAKLNRALSLRTCTACDYCQKIGVERHSSSLTRSLTCFGSKAVYHSPSDLQSKPSNANRKVSALHGMQEVVSSTLIVSTSREALGSSPGAYFVGWKRDGLGDETYEILGFVFSGELYRRLTP